MTLLGMGAPDGASYISTREVIGWGWTKHLSPSPERNYVYFHRGLNVAGYILSPLAGIVRIVVNLIFLAMGKKTDGSSLDEWQKEFFKAQMVRGACELVGAGYLLWIPEVTRLLPCC